MISTPTTSKISDLQFDQKEPSISTISNDSVSIKSRPSSDTVSTQLQQQQQQSSTCRICYSSTSCKWYDKLLSKLGSFGRVIKKKHLIRPCLKCKGSVGAVHDKCLEKWLAISKSDKCDVCKSELVVTKSPKTFRDWLKESDRKVKCYLVTDLLSFLFLTPITALSIFLCVRGLMLHASSIYEVSCLLLLILLVLIPYFAWLATCIYQHYKCASYWCNSNFTINTNIQNISSRRRRRASSPTCVNESALPQFQLTAESSSVTGNPNRHTNCSHCLTEDTTAGLSDRQDVFLV